MDPESVIQPSGAQTSTTLPAVVDEASALVNHGRATPLTVRVELVVVDGAAGKQLARHQAAAVRAVLEWFRDHPTEAADDRHAREGAGSES